MTNNTIKPALSDNWRTAPSLNQPIDMANALRSIKKVIAAVDTRNCEVSFNSNPESHFDYGKEKLQIKIDPKFALKSVPIQGHDFDVLAGLSIHEALHSTCESDKIRNHGIGLYPDIVVLGEEIYIDNYGKRNFPVLGKYIHLSREGYKPESKDISWNNIVTTWGAIAVFGIMPEGPWLSDIGKVAQLQLLMELSSRLMEKDLNPLQRQQLYLETADRLDAMVKQEEIKNKVSKAKEKEPILELEAPKGMVKIDLETTEGLVQENDNGQAEDTQESLETGSEDSEEGEEEGGDSGEEDDNEVGENSTSLQSPDESKKNDGTEEPGVSEAPSNSNQTEKVDSNLPEDNLTPEPVDIISLFHPATVELEDNLIKAIGEVLELGIEDMTQEVGKIFGDNDNKTIIWSKAKTHPDLEFNQTLANQLIWVKDYKNTRGHQIYRNEKRGKIDSQRIYKAPINGLIFKRKVELPKSELDLVMLLDASSSMSDRTSIYDDAKALHKTLPDSHILSYKQNGDGVALTEHTEGRIFHKVETGGGTPTSKAIAATALRYPKSLIIHFTDGECNHNELEELFPKIHDEFPSLKMVHIQLRSKSRYRSEEEENIPEFEGVSKTVMMDSIYEFPEKLKEILKVWQ